jgi:hypothetical protein
MTMIILQFIDGTNKGGATSDYNHIIAEIRYRWLVARRGVYNHGRSRL